MTYDRWKKGEVMIVDVREVWEWDMGHVEGIEWIPLDQLRMRWRELDPASEWICICRSGQRSNYAAAMLRQAGINASNMTGGMLDWKARQLPMTPPGIVG
jgi:rhodanese-related sulfurtransferase